SWATLMAVAIDYSDADGTKQARDELMAVWSARRLGAVNIERAKASLDLSHPEHSKIVDCVDRRGMADYLATTSYKVLYMILGAALTEDNTTFVHASTRDKASLKVLDDQIKSNLRKMVDFNTHIEEEKKERQGTG